MHTYAEALCVTKTGYFIYRSTEGCENAAHKGESNINTQLGCTAKYGSLFLAQPYLNTK